MDGLTESDVLKKEQQRVLPTMLERQDMINKKTSESLDQLEALTDMLLGNNPRKGEGKDEEGIDTSWVVS